eukprot:1271890-Amphidinium_carterae.2
MKASNHTFAIANQPSRLALFKRSDRSQKLCSIDRLLQPRKGQPDTFPTTVKVRVAAVTARTISPHNMDTSLRSQSRFMMNQHLPSRGRQQTMELGVSRAEASIPAFLTSLSLPSGTMSQ